MEPHEGSTIEPGLDRVPRPAVWCRVEVQDSLADAEREVVAADIDLACTLEQIEGDHGVARAQGEVQIAR